MSTSRAIAIARQAAPTAFQFEDRLKGPVTAHTDLIAEEALSLVITELEALCVPTSPERATYWGKVLVGSYPNFKTHDPKTYAVAISSVFADAPDDLCRRAVDEITRAHEFPPSRAVLHKRLEALMGQRRGKIYIAQSMLAEHQRRRDELAEETRRKESRKRFIEEHGTDDVMAVVNKAIADEGGADQ